MAFTKAAFARHVAVVVRRATLESAELAQGMWNPMFCDDDAGTIARRFCEEMQRHIDDIQTHCINVTGTER